MIVRMMKLQKIHSSKQWTDTRLVKIYEHIFTTHMQGRSQAMPGGVVNAPPQIFERKIQLINGFWSRPKIMQSKHGYH